MIVYRHNDRRFPFLWEDRRQPSARWHRAGEGPAHYFADTPGGAWAEFLRHEEITDEADLEGVDRALWAIELGEPDAEVPEVPDDVARGGRGSYPACQDEAARLRADGATALVVGSAALHPGAARGRRAERGLRDGPPADGRVFVLFGGQPDLIGWLVVDHGRPPIELLAAVRPFS
jgi:hypothetical protein